MKHREQDRYALAALAGILTLLFFDVVTGSGVFYTRDVSLYHFPGRSILRDVVMGGELPYWNPFTSGGQPLAANPAHQVFYPLTWLIFLPGLVHGFNWHALIHLYLATLGTYALLRSLGTSRTAAVLGGLSYGLGGFIVAGLSLFPFLFSAAWLPLTCLFTRRFLHDRGPRDFALASLCLGMQFLVGEPVTIAQTGILLGLYALSRKSRLFDVAAVGAISLAALLLSAVQTLPAIDHARDSVRAQGFDFKSVSDWSTPPRRLVEAVYPDVYGSARPDAGEVYRGRDLYPRRGVPFILSIYSGLLAITLAFAGAAARVRGWMLYLTVLALSIVLALGSYTPLLQLLYDLGVVRSIRYPEKFLIMGIFATVLFGALALDELLRGNRRVRDIALGLAAVVAAGGATLYTQTDFWRAAILAALLFVTPRMARSGAAALLCIFVLADLAPRTSELAPRQSASFYDVPPVLQHLDPNFDGYRLLHAGNWSQMGRYRRAYRSQAPNLYLIERNALSGYTAATYGVRSAAEVDFDLTGLRTSDDFTRAAVALQKATGDWVEYVSAMSNVRYVAFYRPPSQAFAEAGADPARIEPIRFVEQPPYPRYYFASDVVTARNRDHFVAEIASGRHDLQTAFVTGAPFRPAAGRVLAASGGANYARLDVEASGPAFLVASITAHKYWTATIDGAPVPSEVTNLGYQGMRVPAGRHVVELRYRNPLIGIGAAVSLVTLLALGFAGWRRRAAGTMPPL